MADEAGSIALRERGGTVVALRSGCVFWDLAIGAVGAIGNSKPHAPVNRFNDGTIDLVGPFWI
jgi:sugar lactone lactonase YvrE